jgi:hypothetical protein
MKGHSRSLLVLSSTLLVVALSWIPVCAAISLSFSVTSPETNLAETLLIGAAALYFGLDTKISAQYRTDLGSSAAAVSVLYLAGESQTAPEAIILDRKKGRGWGALAKGKMPPGLVNKWKGGADPFSYRDDDFETGVSIQFLSTYYATPADTIILWVKRGLSVADVAVCLNLASQAKAKPHVVVDAKLKGKSWIQLAAQYKISVEQLKQPVPPKRKYGKTVPPGQAKKK